MSVPVGSSALHAACAADAAEVAELLIARGADPTLHDQWSQSPLCVAGVGGEGAPRSPPGGFRRAARGSFSAILDLLAATTHLDQRLDAADSAETSPHPESIDKKKCFEMPSPSTAEGSERVAEEGGETER